MADYWKSNERKYCDFCKCWIADNKPSVQFHENGRRHKLNVQKRITEMSKNSYKEQRAQTKMNEDMKKMNDAAMKAYMNDIAGGADISARAQLAIDRAAIGPQIDPIALPADFWSDEEQSSSKSKKKKNESPSVPVVVKPPPAEENPLETGSMWCEAKTDEGHTYYWNVKTNKSVWEPPKEGFMSHEEYQKISRLAYDKQEQEQQKAVKYEVDNAAEIAAKLKREQTRETMEYYQQRKSKIESDELSKEDATSPNHSTNPYGSWEAVEHREEKPIDLQLPEVAAPLYVPSIHPEVPERKFKEKVIDYIPADETSSLTTDKFIRKRKVAGNRNARQRLDTD